MLHSAPRPGAAAPRRLRLPHDDRRPRRATARGRARPSSARAKAGQLSALPSGRVELPRAAPTTYATSTRWSRAHPGLVRPVHAAAEVGRGPRRSRGVEIASDVNRTDDGRPVYVVMGAAPRARVAVRRGQHGVRARPRRRATAATRASPRCSTGARRSSSRSSTPTASRSRAAPSPRRRARARSPLQAHELPARCGTDDPAPRAPPSAASTSTATTARTGAATARRVSDGRRHLPRAVAVVRARERRRSTSSPSACRSRTCSRSTTSPALVLRPPGLQGARPGARTRTRLKTLGDAMGEATGYSSEYGYQLYEVTGATEDWNYVAQGAFGYTIELGGEPGNQTPTFQGPYQTHVVDQYLGSAGRRDRRARGARGAPARRRAGGQRRRPRVVAGSAPAGRDCCACARSFATTTSPICTDRRHERARATARSRRPRFTIDDFLDTTLDRPGRRAASRGTSTRRRGRSSARPGGPRRGR